MSEFIGTLCAVLSLLLRRFQAVSYSLWRPYFCLRNSCAFTASVTYYFWGYFEKKCIFAYSYIRDWEVAEDIFSEAMVQYWMKRDELDVDTNPRAYILTLVKHLSLNYLRHQQVRITVEEELFQSAERELAFRIRTLQDCDPFGWRNSCVRGWRIRWVWQRWNLVSAGRCVQTCRRIGRRPIRFWSLRLSRT